MTSVTTAWPTRAELLRSRAERLRELEQHRYGWRRDVRPGAAMLLAGFLSLSATLELEDDPSGASLAIWWTLVAVALGLLLAAVIRRALDSRKLDAELRSWADLDRTRAARALPPGDIPHELLTPFDARDRPDLDAVVWRAGARSTARLYDTRALAWPGLRATVPWCLGLVLLLGGALSDDGLAAGLPVALVGGVTLIAASAAIWASWTEGFRRQQRLNDSFWGQLYAARAAALTGTTPSAPGSVPLAARVAVGVVGLVMVGVLVIRLSMSSMLAILIAFGILAAIAVLIAPPLLRRRVLHVVPETTDGDTVLDPPRRRIAVDLADGAMIVRPLDDDATPVIVVLADILAVVDLRLGYPFAPPAVGIVTTDENVVFAGSDARRLPAIAAAREAAGSADGPAVAPEGRHRDIVTTVTSHTNGMTNTVSRRTRGLTA